MFQLMMIFFQVKTMIKTSYFAKYKGRNGISIALSSPRNFHGSSYPDLFPTWQLLRLYKQTGDKTAYTKAYMKILNKLDPQKVYKDLDNKTLLCWEKTGSFCHRKIVAQWIQDQLDIEIPECHLTH